MINTSDCPNILFLVHRVPFPPNRGDRIRSYHLLKFLAARSNVWMACLADERVDEETELVLQGYCHRLAIERLGRIRWVRAMSTFGRGRTATEGLFDSRRLRTTIRNWCGQTSFDAVVVFCSSMAGYVDLPELRDVRVLVDLVDVDSQKWLDYAPLQAA